MRTQPGGGPSIEVTGLVQKSAWATREMPPVEALGAGLWSVPVPIPGSPLRYVLSYLVETRRGPVVVDPGWPGDEGWAALTSGLAAAGWSPEDVAGVLLTHAHTDHQGLAARVREASGCWIGMHAEDARILAGYADGSLVDLCNDGWLQACGVPASERANGLEMDLERMRLACDMVPDLLIADHDRGFLGPDRRIEAVWTPGHTPGHLCFALPDDRRLLGGDHLLPRISSHVGGYEDDDGDALHDFLASMVAIGPRVGDLEVLPGHEYRFRGIPARARVVLAHHAERLGQVLDAVVADGPTATTWDVASAITWSRGWDQTQGFLRRLALAETAAHLRWLGRRGLVVEVPGRPTTWRAAVQDRSSADLAAQALEAEYVAARG